MPNNYATAHVDVAIIGAGIVGVAVAYEVLRRGASVGMIAPRNSALGAASQAAGAMLSIFSEVQPDDSELRVTEDVDERIRADALWRIWLQELNDRGSTIFRTRGTWVVGLPDEQAALSRIAAAARQHRHVAETHLASNVPGLVPSRAMGNALWLPSEEGVDADELLGALSAALLAHPRFQWCDDVTVASAVSGDQVVVTGHQGTVTASHAVIAAGVASAAVMPPETALPILLQGRGSGLTLKAKVPHETVIRTPNRVFNCGIHLVPRSNSLSYIGSTNRQEYRGGSSGRPNATVDEIAVLIDSVTSDIDERLFEAEFMGIRTGYRPYTLDRRPLVGTLANTRVHVATGTYRSGYMLAPRIAEIVADEIEQPGRHHDHPYRLTRPGLDIPYAAIGREASLQLISAISEPGGHLPPGVQSRLADFMTLGLNMMLTDHRDETEELLHRIRKMWASAPIAETLPAILRLISSYREREL